MHPALLASAAGMKARSETLDLIASNLANASTTGFKADREFYRLFIGAEARSDPHVGDWRWMPVVQGSRVDLTQGPLEQTGGPLDVALAGPGFLTVAGPDGRTLLTRAGSLARGPGGELLTAGGLVALDDAGLAITLPAEGEVAIAETGWISVGGASVGRLGLVEVAEPGALRKAGANLFEPGAQPLEPASETGVRQGWLEGSNVGVAQSAVELIQAQRHFEMLRRATSLVGDEMEGAAVERLGRA